MFMNIWAQIGLDRFNSKNEHKVGWMDHGGVGGGVLT